MVAANAAITIAGLIRFTTHLLNTVNFLWLAAIAGPEFLTFRTQALSYCGSAALLRDLVLWSRGSRLLYVL